jgi:hypothetical protein
VDPSRVSIYLDDTDTYRETARRRSGGVGDDVVLSDLSD